MGNTAFQSGYSEVNGLKMYYEMHGSGAPLVLIHGGGSTIQTTFGRLIPLLAPARQIIAVELQAHGRTSDRDSDLSFQQDADDVAGLLNNLGHATADFLGFSNGGHTAIEIALRHPLIVNKLILASTFYSRDAAPAQFWEGFETATLNVMPQSLQKGYLAANNDTDGLQNMFNKDVQRMKTFEGWSDEQIRSIKAPTLVINSSMDVGSPEHAIRMYRTIPDCELVIFPGLHGAYLGAIEGLKDEKMPSFNAAGLIDSFLN